MKADFIPKTEGDLDTWEENFDDKITTLGVTLGLTAGEVTDVKALITAHRTAYTTYVSKRTEKEGANQAKLAAKRTAIAEIRRLARIMKASTGYTFDLGERLGIIGPEEEGVDAINAKPTLTINLVGGFPEIGFSKEDTDGIKIYSRRPAAGETSFSFLATDTVSPYPDNRPKLDANTPEKREYYAFFMIDDDVIGQQSEIYSVTVP